MRDITMDESHSSTFKFYRALKFISINKKIMINQEILIT